MEQQESFDRIKRKAIAKTKKGELLKPEEKIAMENMWYFTLPLPITVIDEIVLLSKSYYVKPSKLVEAFIMKGLTGGKE